MNEIKPVDNKTKKQPYGGYYNNHIPEHDPTLTEVLPGTPTGEYMRRFWHPVCMSEELTDVPRFLTILGEDLVAFKDKSGQVGLLHAHCIHRGASLEYGMIQERGIMCSYHGFKFDVDGTCLEVPMPTGEEEEGCRMAKNLCQPAYKAVEKSGLIFAYMGPPEEEPPFPEWEGDFTCHPDDKLVPFSNVQTCNWLQVQDNAADQFHHTPLHTTAVVPGHEQQTTFGEAGANAYLVRPDLQFFPVHDGKSMAWTSSRRVDDDYLFIRINHQILPNLSFHSYLFEDGKKSKHFSRVHMYRWTVPVDNHTCKMIGWRGIGPHIDPRNVGNEDLCGYEKIDFLEGQCGVRRPERAKYGPGDNQINDLPPVPKHHRYRTAYKDGQYAPGDYEMTASQRPIAVHALENPMKFDGGVYLSRKQLREAINGTNPGASTEAWRQWLQETDGKPNTYCSGNVLKIPKASTDEEEVKNRRDVAQRCIAAITESDKMTNPEERAAFVQKKMLEIEQDYA
ncbi:MAG: Rieske 2Fe-2S domain-containing protein [Pseudomonadota bacterium]|nr:Rieske 2Fe-2S domain-containing protein [Pseudomonadota bacterium]